MHITDIVQKIQERLEQLESKGLDSWTNRIAFDELQKLQLWITEDVEYN